MMCGILCEILEVSRSGYYAWRKRGGNGASKRVIGCWPEQSSRSLKPTGPLWQPANYRSATASAGSSATTSEWNG